MKGAVLFAAGLMVGAAVQVPLAQNQRTQNGVVMMNHVGINVANLEEAVAHYSQKMGYREAFRGRRVDGRPAGAVAGGRRAAGRAVPRDPQELPAGADASGRHAAPGAPGLSATGRGR